MMKLQKPVKDALDAVKEDLAEVSKVQKNFAKALDKSFPLQPLPSEHDAMAAYPDLINRAVAMHLLREGQFGVASKFIEEVAYNPPSSPEIWNPATGFPPFEHDERMDFDGGSHSNDTNMAASSGDPQDMTSLQSQELQDKFAEMYTILQDLKQRKLTSAIAWARHHSKELESRDSNLEFELSKLQYVWLFLGPWGNGMPDDENNGRAGALRYARKNFSRFQGRHLREIQQLASSMAFAPNLAESPYRTVFSTETAFADVSASFTREFCSLLGLSAESPLYIAATAGALALPWLLKYISKKTTKNTEWTSANELAFETPLPARMLYHSIFVCPVSKEQTTDANPPMMIPCGHVLAKETLQKLCKGSPSRFKCPYCPSEGQLKDARQIIL